MKGAGNGRVARTSACTCHPTSIAPSIEAKKSMHQACCTDQRLWEQTHSVPVLLQKQERFTPPASIAAGSLLSNGHLKPAVPTACSLGCGAEQAEDPLRKQAANCSAGSGWPELGGAIHPPLHPPTRPPRLRLLHLSALHAPRRTPHQLHTKKHSSGSCSCTDQRLWGQTHSVPMHLQKQRSASPRLPALLPAACFRTGISSLLCQQPVHWAVGQSRPDNHV